MARVTIAVRKVNCVKTKQSIKIGPPIQILVMIMAHSKLPTPLYTANKTIQRSRHICQNCSCNIN